MLNKAHCSVIPVVIHRSWCIFCTDRYAVVRVGKWLIFNIYLPCVGTTDHVDIVQDVLQDIWSWRLKYMDCGIIIGQDFNTNLAKCNDVSNYINKFPMNHLLFTCETDFPSRRLHTYVNESFGY